jgi:hypothetical protein
VDVHQAAGGGGTGRVDPADATPPPRYQFGSLQRSLPLAPSTSSQSGSQALPTVQAAPALPHPEPTLSSSSSSSPLPGAQMRDTPAPASPASADPPPSPASAPSSPSWTPPRRPRGRWAGGGPSAGGADRAGAACEDDGDSRSRSDSRSPVRVDFAAHGRPVCKRTPQPPAAQAPLHFTIQVHGRRGAARSRCRASAVDGSSSSSTIATAPPVVITMELSQDEADLVQALRRELARAP